MNWCCVSLIVAVPNFMTKSAAVAGTNSAHHASAAATATAADLLPRQPQLPRRIVGVKVIVPPLDFMLQSTLPAKLAPGSFLSTVAHGVHQYLVLAAVDLDHRAIDEERKIGGKIGDEIGDFVAFGDAAERNARRRELVGYLEAQLHVALHGFDQSGPPLGADRSGIDGDDADIVLAVLAGDGVGDMLAGW